MRLHLHMAGYVVILALLVAAAAPAGLNLCIQKSGKASIGLSCACDNCAGQPSPATGKASDSCCQSCGSGTVLHDHCCTCSQLPALASISSMDKNPRPKLGSQPALKPPAMFVLVHQTAGHSLGPSSLFSLPPLLSRCTVLRL